MKRFPGTVISEVITHVGDTAVMATKLIAHGAWMAWRNNDVELPAQQCMYHMAPASQSSYRVYFALVPIPQPNVLNNEK